MGNAERSVWVCPDHGPGEPAEYKWLTGDGKCSCGRRMVKYVPAADLEGAVALLATFVDDVPCSLDHHGYCQAHDWLDEGECNVARARRLTGGQ